MLYSHPRNIFAYFFVVVWEFSPRFYILNIEDYKLATFQGKNKELVKNFNFFDKKLNLNWKVFYFSCFCFSIIKYIFSQLIVQRIQINVIICSMLTRSGSLRIFSANWTGERKSGWKSTKACVDYDTSLTGRKSCSDIVTLLVSSSEYQFAENLLILFLGFDEIVLRSPVNGLSPKIWKTTIFLRNRLWSYQESKSSDVAFCCNRTILLYNFCYLTKETLIYLPLFFWYHKEWDANWIGDRQNMGN